MKMTKAGPKALNTKGGSRQTYTAKHKRSRTALKGAVIKPVTAVKAVQPVYAEAASSDAGSEGRITFTVMKGKAGMYGIRAVAKDAEPKKVTVHIDAAGIKRIRIRNREQRYMLDDDNILEKETIENRKKELLSVMRAF